MKKAVLRLRKLKALANEILGEEETDKIIKETVDEVLEEIKEVKPKRKKKVEK